MKNLDERVLPGSFGQRLFQASEGRDSQGIGRSLCLPTLLERALPYFPTLIPHHLLDNFRRH
jgi:hypothetical protein